MLIGAWVMSALALATPARAEPPPVEAYAHPPNMAQPSFSPDGTHIAYLSPVDGRQRLLISPIRPAPGEKPVVISPSDAEIAWFDWVNPERLLIGVIFSKKLYDRERNDPLRFTKMISLNRDGSDQKVLLDRRNHHWIVVSTGVLQFLDREHVLVPYPMGWDGAFDIVKVNVYTGDMTKVVEAARDVSEYIPDPAGRFRLAAKYDPDEQTYTYMVRQDEDGPYRPVRTVRLKEDPSFGILGFGRDPGKVYVSSAHGDGRAAVYEMDLATGELGPRLVEDARHDVDGALVRRGEVVAFDWQDDLPARRWLDPTVQAVQDRLDKALPDSREIIVDRTPDGRYTLVASFSGREPVGFRLLDRETKEFAFYGDTYPSIPQEALGDRRPVSYKARDGLEVPGYLTLPPGREGRNLPLVVVPHGGPFYRDTLAFDPLPQFLASRGYAVLQPNFRGSTGYGESFHKAGHREWGGKMQDDVTDGVRWAVAQGIADPARVCIAGWSYGGFSALVGALQTPDLYRCAIATAPVTHLTRIYSATAGFGARSLNRHVHFGEDRDRLKAISPVDNAASIGIPVLLVHGEMDVQAEVQHSRVMAAALKKARRPYEYIEIEGMDHSPRTTAEMEQVMQAWEKFLARHLGP
ncbi:MAG TPA: S9 family peptidase [Azospirillaceae bacterium]|nr:S9 family peptidase [Azospirillaceae bacterium]